MVSCKPGDLSPFGKTIAGRKASLDINRRRNGRYPEKTKARAAVNYSVSTGKLFKPSKCDICKKIGRIEGHHMDYAKPLEAIWLCIPCHSDYHRL
jgi:hypothetical protein